MVSEEISLTLNVGGLTDDQRDRLRRDAELCRELADHLAGEAARWFDRTDAEPVIPAAPQHYPDGDCGWGFCDFPAVTWRWHEQHGWMQVCVEHGDG